MSYMGKVYQGFAKGSTGIERQNKPNGLFSYTFFRIILVLALIQTITIEAVQRAGLFSALFWLAANPQIFVLNYFLTIIVFLFFISLTGSLYPAFVFSSVSLILLAAASFIKRQFLGDPLFPWDFFRLDQVWDILPQYSGEVTAALIVLVLLTAGLILIGKFLIPSYKAGRIWRSVLLLIIVVLLPVIVFYRHTPIEQVLKKANIEHIYWAQNENSLKNGFLLGFAMNLENTMIFEPEGYNAQEIKRIVEENTPSSTALSAVRDSRPEKAPNIVFILNEAFWDPQVLPNLSFSRDPVSFFHELQTGSISGMMISPVFGGSTANVEFEILTGLSTKFLPHGAIAYQQYIDRPIPAIPAVFKENGYVATAVHPYHDWFYKRDTVYPLLGFDNFYSLQDFDGSEIKGEYISDLEVTRKIVSEIKLNEEPAFIFAVTMQNHGPYPEERYAEKDISVQGSLSPEGRGILETYAQGLCDADEALRVLIAELKQGKEPTAVVFMGDHLPYLGKDYLVYKETGYLEEKENKWSLAESLKMKEVPFVIWTNYNTGLPSSARVSAKYLGGWLLRLAGLQGTFLNNFTGDLAGMLPVYEKTVTINQQGEIFAKMPAELQTLERDYWLLQYDVLFGEQYYQEYAKSS